MLFPTIVHSSKRLLSTPSLIPFVNHSYWKEGDHYLLPFRCHVISHHKMLIDGHFLFPVWNMLTRQLLRKQTKFPFVYATHGGHVMEWEPSCFTTYDVISHGKCYRQAVRLWEDVPAPTYTLLFSIDQILGDELVTNKLM